MSELSKLWTREPDADAEDMRAKACVDMRGTCRMDCEYTGARWCAEVERRAEREMRRRRQ